MTTFLGGQILKGCRGELVAIVTKGEEEDYSAFLYPFGSEELVYLTGIGSVKRPVVRAYAGVSKEAGELVTKCMDYLNTGSMSLMGLDLKIAVPHFI